MIELVRFTRDDSHASGHRVYVNPAMVTHVYRHASGEGTVIFLASLDEEGQSQIHVAERLRDVVAYLTGQNAPS